MRLLIQAFELSVFIDELNMQMQDNLGSIIFVIFYLVVIWIFLFKLIKKNKQNDWFKKRKPVWKLTFLAYFLLGFGDVFHLGFRIIIFFAGWGPDYHLTNFLMAFGYIATGITMTYFYIALYHAWVDLYGEKYYEKKKIRLFMFIEYIAFIVRLFLVSLPYNRWYEGNATVDFGFDFRIISAIPIYVIGITTVYLLLKTSKAEMKEPTGVDPEINRGMFKAGIWYIVSYATYSVTTFFVAIYPLTGLFMIPKTIAYLVAFYYHYTTLLNKPPESSKSE